MSGATRALSPSGKSYAAEFRAHAASEAFLAGLYRHSQFVVARASFHEVHLYEPEIITNAILQVLASARTAEALPRGEPRPLGLQEVSLIR
jgi:hypothetical protein